MKKFNPFHLVTLRPWPIIASMSFLRFILRVIIIVREFINSLFILSSVILILSSYLWGRDINREGSCLGDHNSQAIKGFKVGIILFILSECFFFFGMFWSYFHLAEAPAVELGGIWPPQGIMTFDPIGIPFLNTILLVSSGISVTWTHHAIEKRKFSERIKSLIFTVILGITFTSFQLIEYYTAGFTFSCSAYSSIYFLGTGFHGLHVLIGRVLLIICLMRFRKKLISANHRIGFECSVWYWHFVDIVWFCLYLIFYWWGV